MIIAVRLKSHLVDSRVHLLNLRFDILFMT